MANVDDRVVSMSFESTKFQQGVSSSMSLLDKLNAALKKVGVDNGLDNIEKSANKISFGGLGTAIDKIKAKFGRGIPEADQAFSDVEKGANKVTLTPIGSAIDKLKGRFNFPEADSAFSGIEKAAGKVTFHGLSNALDGIGKQFGVLEGIASVALGNISSQMAMRASAFTKSLSLGPIVDGFKEYETQINAVQTILGNTKASGATLKDVSKALNELNHYADKTIYNFTEMAKNIGTFTAAGVDLDTATSSIKGIANLAALSGSNAQQASTAMYQLSQAISSGKVSLMDWRSVENAGMGGTVFKRSLVQTAEAMGTLDKSSVKLVGKMKNVRIEGSSFRDSIMAAPGKESWLTSKVLTNTLQQLSGDLNTAQLKAQGFSDAQIKAIKTQAKMALDAATKVKTLSALLSTTKEQIGSGWASTWKLVFGDFGEAKTLFTGISSAIGNMVGANADARNSTLKTWKDLGGRTILLKALKDAFTNLANILSPIKQAFRDVFPKKTASDLLGMTNGFKKLVDAFKIGPETAYNLRRTFAGFFAVVDIGKQILGGFVTVIKTIFSEIGKGSGGFLSFTGDMGDALVVFDEWLKKGKVLETFFKGLGTILSVPIKLLSKLGDKLSGAFSGFGGSDSGEQMASSFQKVTGVGDRVLKILTKIFGIWYNLSGLIYAAVAPAVSKVVEVFRDLGNVLGEAVTQNNFDNFIKVLQTSLIGGIFLAIKKAIGGGVTLGITKPIKSVMDTLTGTMKNMQTAIKAVSIEKIAIAIALLAASAIALSLVKPERLASAMAALAAGFGELLGTLAILSKISGLGIATPIIAASFILLAGSMVILAGAVALMSRLSWEELAKGLVGVAGGMAILVKGAKGLIKVGPSLIPVGIGLIAIAGALNIMAIAVKIFATMSWGELAKGLAGVAAALVIVSKLTLAMPYGLAGIGAGLVLIAMGLTAMTAPIRIFAAMDWGTIGKGLVGVAATIAILGKALTTAAFTKTLPIVGAGLILVGIGLTAISGAVAVMGGQDIATLVKGLAAIGGALKILAKGLIWMDGALPGAAALLVAAAGLAILVPVLAILGNMKFLTFIKGIGYMVVALGALAAIAVIAGPGLVLLGLGVAGLGLGVMAIGKGVELLAKAIILLGEDGAKGVGILIAAFATVIAVIPKVIVDFLKGIVAIGGEIVKLLPHIVSIGVKITIALIDGLIQALPKVAEFIAKLIQAIVKLITENSGPLITAGFKLLTNLLTGIQKNIGQITRTVGTIMVRFLTALAQNAGKLVNAGATLLIKFLDGLARNAGRLVTSGVNTVAKFLEGLAKNTGKLVTSGAKVILEFIKGIGNNIGKIAGAALEAVGKFVTGIAKNLWKLRKAAVDFAEKFITEAVKGLIGMASAAAEGVVKFLDGLAEAIRTYGPELIRAGVNIATAIVEGVADGLSDLPSILGTAFNRMFDGAPDKFKPYLRTLGFATSATIASMLNDGTRKLIFSEETQAIIDKFAVAATAYFEKSMLHRTSETQTAGQFLLNSFSKGLRGSQREIDSAFVDMNSKLSSAMQSYNQIIRDESDKIKRLKEKHKDTYGPIVHAKNVRDANKDLLDVMKEGSSELNGYLATSKSQLEALSIRYDQVAKLLETANTRLTDAKRAQSDALKSYSDQYSALPTLADAVAEDGTAVNQLEVYTKSLTDQVAAVKAYQATLAQLQTMGLDDETYRKLVEEGTVDQKFADQIVAGGPAAIAALKGLGTELDAASGTLATEASKKLYQAGVDLWQKTVDGLTDDKVHKKGLNQIRAAMDDLADAMIERLKDKLKIKSPSEEFAKIGKFSALGMANGLRASSKYVTRATSDMSDDALVAMRDNMARISESLATNIDANPTITPILDLSVIQKDAKKLAGITDISPLVSLNKAMTISPEQDNSSAPEDSDILTAGVHLTQNNYSPKALSETEIYRQTNNQLSQAKKALGK